MCGALGGDAWEGEFSPLKIGIKVEVLPITIGIAVGARKLAMENGMMSFVRRVNSSAKQVGETS